MSVRDSQKFIDEAMIESVKRAQRRKSMNASPQFKDTNPKDAVGTKKIPSTTRSSAVDMEVGVGMLEGARKYGRHNYRVAGVRASVYIDATKRHLDKWWDFGEDIDPDSGLSHITKAICSLYVLRDAMINGMYVDDRPPPVSLDHYNSLQKVVDSIFEKYPNALPAYTAEDVKSKAV
jgi:hypothetical protein